MGIANCHRNSGCGRDMEILLVCAIGGNMDIVARLRLGGPNALEVVDEAADTIEFLRTEVDRLGESLNKCHEQMQRCPDGPVHGPELELSLSAGGRYRAPECGGFQGHED